LLESGFGFSVHELLVELVAQHMDARFHLRFWNPLDQQVFDFVSAGDFNAFCVLLVKWSRRGIANLCSRPLIASLSRLPF
jgi:hypothetical protein